MTQRFSCGLQSRAIQSMDLNRSCHDFGRLFLRRNYVVDQVFWHLGLPTLGRTDPLASLDNAHPRKVFHSTVVEAVAVSCFVVRATDLGMSDAVPDEHHAPSVSVVKMRPQSKGGYITVADNQDCFRSVRLPPNALQQISRDDLLVHTATVLPACRLLWRACKTRVR